MNQKNAKLKKVNPEKKKYKKDKIIFDNKFQEYMVNSINNQ